MVFAKTCTECAGSGRQRRQSCGACQTIGVTSRTDEITVQVPPGVSNGTRMRVPGEGNSGRHGGSPGDLYITASVEEHRLFRRNRDDLHIEVPVTVSEAVLGATFKVPGLHGPIMLQIPPGTDSGQQVRVHGEGAPSPRSGTRGDLVVTLIVALPKVKDERSKELLREFARINESDVRKVLFSG